MHSDAVHNLWVFIPVSGVNSSELNHLLKLPVQGTGQFSTFLYLTQSTNKCTFPVGLNIQKPLSLLGA